MQCAMDGCDNRAIRYGLCREHDWGEAVDEAPALQREGADVTTAERHPKHCTETTKAGKPCRGFRMANSDKCAGHNRLGAVANPRANQAKSAQARKEKATERESRVETALELKAAGVRGALLAALEARHEAVVRVLVTEPIENGNARVLLEALNQALGRPTEHVQVDTGDPLRRTLETMPPEERRAMLLELTRRQDSNVVPFPKTEAG